MEALKSAMILSLLALATAEVLKPEESGTRLRRSDDANLLESLQSLVMQQASQIQQQQARLEAAENTIGSLTENLQEMQYNVRTQQFNQTATADKVSTLGNNLQLVQNNLNTLQYNVRTQQSNLTATADKVSTLGNNLQLVQNKLNTQQSSLTSLQSRVNSYSTTVAFSARISRSRDTGSVHGISLGNQQTVIFDETITNIGNGYSSYSGVFTTPVSGLYVFFLNQMSPNEHEVLILAMVKNNVIVDKVFAEGQSDNWDQGSTQVVTHLAYRDRVWIRQVGGDAVRGDWWTIFTGYLLKAD